MWHAQERNVRWRLSGTIVQWAVQVIEEGTSPFEGIGSEFE